MRWLRLLAVLLLLGLLTGCSTLGYYAQSVNGHLDLMARRQSIAQLLTQADTPDNLRQRLELVSQIRTFASAPLALPDNRSYRSYAALGREAMVWSLVATPEFSIAPQQWCYLVIGCASYRGYFQRSQAQQHADRLQAEGLDVTVEPVPAYSTLGWFNDPVPSTVIDWPEPRLAGLIFHELAHQQLYVAGDSAFNESFANAVEQSGVRRWLEKTADSQQMAQWRRTQERERAFVALLLQSRTGLETLYASNVSAGQMRERKGVIFAQLRTRYAQLKRQWGGYAGYDRWFSRPLNNARLASIATYEQWLPAFNRLLQQANGDMAAFYRASRALAELPMQPRREEMARLRDATP